jgi:NAD(P)-dependent dehydrogenase (short-subunit alcohol dehydrogenase family)
MTGDRLAGRVAVVTGAASGIGAATVRRFVAEGASVVVADLQDDAGRQLAGELGAAAAFHRCDVTVEGDVADAVDLAVSRFGHLDVMVNNAGIIGAVGTIANSDMDDVDRTLAVIVRGAFLGTKHAARVMVPRRSGVILSTSSPAGIVGGLGAHAYSAGKAAIIGLTRSVAAELRSSNIRVNCIVPGATVTPMTAAIVTGDPDALEATAQQMASGTGFPMLMGRACDAADIAAAAVYLASDDSLMVTATTLTVDAGLTWAPGSSPYATAEHDRVGALLEAGRRGAPHEAVR